MQNYYINVQNVMMDIMLISLLDYVMNVQIIVLNVGNIHNHIILHYIIKYHKY